MTKNTDEILSLLFSLGRQLRQRESTAALCNYLQLETLRFVAEEAGASMKDIADYLLVTPPSATALVGGLVAIQLLTRHTDPSDRRAVRIILTKKGKLLLKKALQQRGKRLKKMLQRLNQTEQAALHSLLRTMIY